MNDDNYLPDKKIEIDEEGYPMFSGIRADDELLLCEYIDNLHRAIPGEYKFPLVTKCGGVEVWVDAFDCPLVAQNIDAMTKDSSHWIFPGGHSREVEHSSILVDPWDRLHTFIGPDQIPAVLSRKAQAAFLEQVDVDSFDPQPYWPNEDEVSKVSRWDAAYKEEKQGFEMGGPNPALVDYGVPSLVSSGGKVLVPGAGRGNDAHFISKEGFDVTALDFSPLAEKEFHSRYPDSKVKYLQADVFRYTMEHSNTYDAVFEHTIFCAINPSRRVEYLNGIRNTLKPGGIYFGLFFILSWQGGPPFGSTQWELRELLQQSFNIKAWEIARSSHPRRKARELWAVLEKK